jgi:DNA polymerase III subunit delta'
MVEPKSAVPQPRDNPILLGHGPAEAALARAFHSGKLHHAWLIAGPRGIGKATLAFRFARFLLATGKGGTAEGASSSLAANPAAPLAVAPDHPLFRRIASGGHGDMLTLERRINERTGRLRPDILVEDVRSVANLLAHTPAEEGWRVVVIDAAEDMSRSSANAMLKALEEPPGRCVFLLVSHAPGQVLPTIRSRCRRLTLPPLPLDVVAALLRRYRPELCAEEADSLAQLSEGSIGLALSLAEQGGLKLYETILDLMQKLPVLDIVALDQLGDQLAGSGSDEKFAIVRDLLGRLLTRLVTTAALDKENNGGASQSPEHRVLARLASAASLDRWLEVWEKTYGLLARGEHANLDRKQVVLDLFLTFQSAVRS